MDDLFLHIARDLGFPALVAAYVLLRLDRRLAQVERCLVRICVILSASTGVQVEDLEDGEAGEPSPLHPVRKDEGGSAGAAKGA